MQRSRVIVKWQGQALDTTLYNSIMDKYISSDPNILGGKPVIKGTRIPIDQILFLLKDGFTIQAIHELYPHVEEKTIKGVIDEAVDLVNNVAQTA